MDKSNLAPFYSGQQVVATSAPNGSAFKNGTHYEVSKCEYKTSGNPISPPDAKYWYVGIVGFANGEAWFAPYIFSPLQENISALKMTFSEIVEVEKMEILLNN